jgi:hypothetical protein
VKLSAIVGFQDKKYNVKKGKTREERLSLLVWGCEKGLILV